MIYFQPSQCIMSVTPSRGLYLYLKTLEIAMDDEIVTDDEATILHVLANALGVSPGDTAECLSIVRGEEKNPFDELDDQTKFYRIMFLGFDCSRLN